MKVIMQAVEAAKKIAESLTPEEMQELVDLFEAEMKPQTAIESDNEEALIRQTLADIVAEIFADFDIAMSVGTEDRLRLLHAFGNKSGRQIALNIFKDLEVTTDSLEEKIAKFERLLPSKEIQERVGAYLGIAKVLTDDGWKEVQEMRFISKDEVIRIVDGSEVTHFGITIPASRVFTEDNVFIIPGTAKVLHQLLDGKSLDDVEM